MRLEASLLGAAVAGLVRSDPHGPGITRVRVPDGFRYLDPSGSEITQAETLDRAARDPRGAGAAPGPGGGGGGSR